MNRDLFLLIIILTSIWLLLSEKYGNKYLTKFITNVMKGGG